MNHVNQPVCASQPRYTLLLSEGTAQERAREKSGTSADAVFVSVAGWDVHICRVVQLQRYADIQQIIHKWLGGSRWMGISPNTTAVK